VAATDLFEPFSDTSAEPAVRGFLHRTIDTTCVGTAAFGRPAGHSSADFPYGNDALVLTHGAGADCQSALLIVVASAFADIGFDVLRCDLPYRQQRPFGPPRPGDATRDRAGLRNAVSALRKIASGRIFLGGHSYGGRQASMLCAEQPGLVDGLLLLSYPLHPPRKSAQLRTQHLPNLQTPALFVHGTRDPFGSIEEIEAALRLIPAKTLLVPVEAVGHDLGFKGKVRNESLASTVQERFCSFFG